MTGDQTVDLAQEMRARWPHSEIPKATVAILFDDLKELEWPDVRAAMLALYREGREFAPNGGQIRAKVAELGRDDPDHGSAWALAMKAVKDFGSYREEEAVAWLQERSESVAEAVRRFGFKELCWFDLSDIAIHKAQFRDTYRAVVEERRQTDAYAGLPESPLRRLQRAKGELRPAGPAFAEIAKGGS